MAILAPVDVRTVWDAIRPGVELVRKRSGADWRAEDVYAACVAGESHLFMAPSGGAFFVLSVAANEYTGELECLISVGHISDSHYEGYVRQLANIAREAGAVRMVMASGRPGWERRAGWRKLYTTYAMEL